MPDKLSPKLLVSILFTCIIVLGAFVVLSPFLLAIIWAAIIAIASWPMYQWAERRCQGNANHAAALCTTIICFALVGPMALLLVFLTQDILSLTDYLIRADTVGVAPPIWLAKVPWAGEHLLEQWNRYLSSPNQLSLFMEQMLSTRLDVIQGTAQALLVDLSGRIATLLFALWVLYFFYRDGRKLISMLNRIGYKWLERRWPAYVYLMPDALRAAVNGLVIVGFGEAVLLSILFYVCGVPSPVLFGLVTAVLAFVPGAAPLLLGILAAILFASGSAIAAIVLFALGMVIVLAADYSIRPMLMQGGTQLPFLGILFGIFGGVLTMGVVGLIIGPVILVLFMVFFREAALDEDSVNLDFEASTESAALAEDSHNKP